MAFLCIQCICFAFAETHIFFPASVNWQTQVDIRFKASPFPLLFSFPDTNSDSAKRKYELRARILITEGWPADTTEAAVRAAFPTATRVGLRVAGGRFTGQAAVYFAMAEAATQAATVEGSPFRSTSAGVRRQLPSSYSDIESLYSEKSFSFFSEIYLIICPSQMLSTLFSS